jgi:hypothetical protein
MIAKTTLLLVLALAVADATSAMAKTYHARDARITPPIHQMNRGF